MPDIKIIAVDLDGTLTLTDTLHESVIALARDKPLLLFTLPFWLARSRAALKAKLADYVELDVVTLPYNQPLIDWLKEERTSGKRIVLCSATNERIAHAVADHLKIFDDVVASDSTINLKSTNKRKALDDQFGKKSYDYVGNSLADIEVWAGARQAIVVNASNALHKKAQQVTTVSKVFPSKPITLSDWCKVFRVQLWLKNVLLFVPLLLAHQFSSVQSLFMLILAFISFSLCDSAFYMTKDLLNLESDRRNPRKHNRPFADATIPCSAGTILVLIFAIASLALGWMVGTAFFKWLIVFIILNTIYLLVLKRIAFVKHLTLAVLFTLRIIAGAVVVSVVLQFQLLVFSVFIFLALAFLKRII